MNTNNNQLQIFTLLLLILTSCNTPPSNDQMKQWESEIVDTEKQFSDLSQKEGLVTAFQTFAANEGVIKRKGKIIKGNNAITEYYKNNPKPNQTLSWKPDFVEVSKSGDLGYTYGTAIFATTDSVGRVTEKQGKFHTVWKRQPDGQWKFVWD